jgi:1-acyl-sn-glycerol-3-phosphate acyltransferase
MRTLFVFLTLVGYTAFWGAGAIVAGLFGVQEKPGGIYQRAMHAWSRAVLRATGATVVMHNPERMSETEGRVFIANHVSWYDIFALAAVIPRYTWIAKAELQRIPFFAQAAQAAGIIFIERDRQKSAFESYRVAAESVKRGRSVVICPEGTRGKDYHLRPFKKGPFVLAIAAQALVIPTIVHGTREIMPKGSFRIRRGTITIHFLEPVSTVGYTYEDRARLMDVVWTRMADEMRRLYGIQTAEHAIATEGERKE